MLEITLENAGKRYNRDWIFRGINHTFFPAKACAITGNNGSGKSTLLQCISGAIELKEGKVAFTKSGAAISSDNFYAYIAIVAPYLELVEEMTALEMLRFHGSFKPFLENISITNILDEVQLLQAADKQIRYYSSGMKQRLKLAQAVFSNVPVLLLDEPCTNLDQEGYELYHYLINTYCKQRTVIVSSNDKNEYSFCKEIIDLRAYKNISIDMPDSKKIIN